jgi:prepilin-type N-terminal cleavage/methylation domain-containing protein
MDPTKQKQRANMSDIAAACDVSKMTVSRVLRNAEYGVSREVRERVLECAQRMNYRPNLLAKQFASKRSGYIGLALPFEGLLGSTYFSRLVAGIQSGLVGSDWQLALFDTLSESFDEGDKLAGLYYEQRVDGLIAIAPHSNEHFVENLCAEDIPVVIAGEPTLNDSVLSIAPDDELCVKDLTEYLIRRGHRDIGFIEGPENLLSARLRVTAFRRAMGAQGLPVNDAWVIRGDYSRSATRDRALNFIADSPLPTAFIAANDLMALGFLDAANILGVRVPSEISVVGIDDLEAAKSSYPPLTTVHQPVRKMGKIAVERLLEWIVSEKKPAPLKSLKATLVERSSVADRPRTSKKETAPPAPARGFTLIELLTVIAVIGVLAAILIPAISGVRNRANESVATSNLRQIYAATMLSKNESGGLYPAMKNYAFDGPRNVEGELVAESYPYMQEKLEPYLGEQLSDGDIQETFRNPVVLANRSPAWLQEPIHTHFRYNVWTAPGNVPLDDGQAIVLFDVVWPDWPASDLPYSSDGEASIKVVRAAGGVEAMTHSEYVALSGGAESAESDFYAEGWTR